ncbi:FAD/NAD(P)-binding protein [Streptomyces hygroscopicus]|uniref:FAD/NAD(P)-binding protein n=1 Tax=Streptomyces hygroscopicus TaxID=1912 RepID=UPI000834CE36|nr:FAD/NAD(P)-binding protein [Streptomyces hygroscopicus]GLV72632.1 adenylate cyclase [Streptomyces hygroscopicus subsp. hygroscopicus]
MNDSAVPAQAPDRRPVDAVVVGAGPRGVSVLERLVARAVPGDRPLRAVLVDPYPPGAGRVWRRDQPPQLLMNTMVADNTVFPDGSVRLDAPVDTGPTFSEWLRAIAGKGHPDSTAAEFAARADDRDYAPRRVYGAYLSDALERIRAAAGDRIRIAVRTAAVVRVTPLAAPGDASAAPGDASAAPAGASGAPAGYQVVLDDGDRLAARAVVLATGHLDAPAAPPRREPLHLPGGHPTDYALDTIAPGARVLLRGGGLNAFDVLALLTLGRGGRFGEHGYTPSGREPRIWITSRRGVPFHARVDAPGVTAPVAFLTPERVAALAARDRLDFRADVLPWLLADLELAWYDRVLELHPGHLPDPGALRRALAEPPGPDREAALRTAAPAALRLDLDAVAEPLRGRSFARPAELDAWWARHLDADVAAATDPRVPPPAALAVAIRQARPALRRLITAGNLSGASYRRDVLGWFNGFANFVSGGPPALRVRQLRALLDAGVVRLLGPARPGTLGESAVVAGLSVRPDAVIDAWLPGTDVTTDGPGVVRRLLADGVARPHRLPPAGPDAEPLPTGALDVRPADGRVRRPDGTAHRALFAVGVPLEGVRWTTAIGARPGTNADFFHETDRVAAELLRAVAPPQGGHTAAPVPRRPLTEERQQ